MYNGGEVATFSPDVAAELLADGVAERVEPDVAEVATAQGDAHGEAPKRPRGRAS